MLKPILYGTLTSILVFFAVSFLTILPQLHSPFHRLSDGAGLNIGFPFTYYYQFFVDCPAPIVGWKIENLFLDCFITWVVVVLAFFVYQKVKT